MKSPITIVLGLGKTGLSCVRYLARQGRTIVVMDNRDQPPALSAFQQEFPNIPAHLGLFADEILDQADEIVISPGLSLQESAIQKQLDKGKAVIGDIELFARAAKAPIVAITGSNGKSTVTTLVGEMVKQAGLAVQVAGNIGLPVLDALEQPVPDWYVLELSSFQLETTYSLTPYAASILNITEDHRDRYASFTDYKDAKQRIYRHSQYIIFNRDDSHTINQLTSSEFSDAKTAALRFNPVGENTLSFGLDEPNNNEWGIIAEQGQTWLAKGKQKLLTTPQLKIIGKHNWANALAALALGDAMKLPIEAMTTALTTFAGLAHRCQWVGEKNGVQWYNDSKATNVGAAIAAIEGLGQTIPGKIILLAGGEGKGADFSPFTQPIAQYARTVILYGADAPQIAKAIPPHIIQLHAKAFEEVIQLAAQQAQPGDVVLLAPACASFDMFNNFEQRGEIFKELVRAILQ